MPGAPSDRFGARGFATAGMAVFGGSFIGLMLLPADFPYWAFALLTAANGIGGGLFAALPPVSSPFAAVLGANPVQHELADRGALAALPAAHRRVLTGREFFPHLISARSTRACWSYSAWPPSPRCCAAVRWLPERRTDRGRAAREIRGVRVTRLCWQHL